MKIGDLVKHVDRKDAGVVTKIEKIRENIKVIWVFWANGDVRGHQSDYYLEVVSCK